MEWGIFNEDSADYTAAEAVEADFWSEAEAKAALAERYAGDDDCYVHQIEEDSDE